MVSQTITIAQLIESGIRLSWREAVALTLSVASLGERRRPGECEADLLSGIALDATGATAAIGSACPALSVSELALFLVQLIPPEGPPELRAPAGVYLAIGRALGVVEAPSFSSVSDFASALGRFERGSRPVLLRQVYARFVQTRTGSADRATSVVAVVPERTHKVEEDRRTSGPRVDALRRMLRERDHHDYLVRAHQAETDAEQESGWANRQSADALRRPSGETRRANSGLRAGWQVEGSKRHFWAVVALALATAVVACLGIAERYERSASAVPTPPQKVQSTDVRVAPAPVVQESARDARSDKRTSADDSVRTTPAGHAAIAPASPLSASGGTAHGARGLSSAASRRVVRRNAVHPSASAARASTEGEQHGASEQAAVAAKRPRRLPPPLRLFAALGRRLSNAFRDNQAGNSQ